MPSIYQFREFTAAGGLMSYGSSITDGYRLVGGYAMKHLEDLGFVKIKSAGRIPPSQQYFRRSVITDAGRAALAATAQ